MSSTFFDKEPHPVDILVGARMRARRKELRISQAELGKMMGDVSFQQVQKYESGANRLSASKLFEAAQALKVQTSYFFEEIGGAEDDAESRMDFARLLSEPGQPELSRLYASLPSREKKRALLSLVRAMASPE
ncbi:MAG: helix-turn-helix domain-containing protein [Caulobacteraceae bacterium]